MQSESQSDNQIEEEREQWSFDWWKTQHSNQGKYLQIGKFQNQNSDHYTLNLFNQQLDIQEHWDQEQFNRKAKRKVQNKISAKRTREKKKQQFEQIKEKNKLLQEQNYKLRQQKLCRRCSRPLNNQQASRIQFQSNSSQNMLKKHSRQDKQFVFKQFQLNKKRQNQGGKLWIALGILLLILGLQIHGIFGSQQKYIRIPKNDIGKWNKQFNEREDMGKLSIRMKTKSGQQMMNIKNTKTKHDKIDKIGGLFQRFTFQSQEQFQQQIQHQEEDKFTFDKDLLFAIQAQFQGNGRYI